jgi:integral membrane protein
VVASIHSEELSQLRRMRAVSLFEGTTLVLLLGIAVPLKHVADIPLATSIMGPIHGIAFVLYIWMLIQTVSIGAWTRAATVRMIVAALLPFGAFVNERALARRQASLATSV